MRRAVHALTKDSGISTAIDCYDEGNGVDFADQSTDGTVSFAGIPATVLPAGGIGRM